MAEWRNAEENIKALLMEVSRLALIFFMNLFRFRASRIANKLLPLIFEEIL
jgi:hypothetical protein